MLPPSSLLPHIIIIIITPLLSPPALYSAGLGTLQNRPEEEGEDTLALVGLVLKNFLSLEFLLAFKAGGLTQY